MTIPPEYLKKKSKTIPFGYELSEIEGYFKPIPQQLEVLHKYLNLIREQKCSLREASSLIQQETNRKIEQNGLYTKDGYEYTKYNIFTQTGRPANSNNGINYAALNKDDGTRTKYISRFADGYLAEFDYDA